MTLAARSQRLAGAVLLVAATVAQASDPTAAMFDPLRVLEIGIDLPQDDWDRLRAQERTFVSVLRGQCLAQPFPHPYTWFRADVTIDGQSRPGSGLRKKGFFGSLDTVKPALRIDLDEFEDNAAIHGVKRLTLNNAKQDPSLVRQCIGYQLFAAAGLPAPRCNFAHVTINGHDHGIYVNVEEIRKPMLARHFADAEGNLYEGTISDFHPVLVDTFETQSNESTNDRSDLDSVLDALGASDADLPAALGSVVDLDRFRTFWAMEGLVGMWDGYAANRNNFYLYRDPVAGRFHFIPWGIDGILADGSPVAAFNPAANNAMFAYSTITRRLVDQPDAMATYVARMNALLGTVWDEAAIHAEIDRMQALLEPYAGDLSGPLADVRAFVTGRRARVAQELGKGLPAFPPFSVLDYCLKKNGVVAGGFIATWGTHGGAAPFTTGAATLGGNVSGLTLDVAEGGADAGLSPSDPNPHRAVLTAYLAFDDGRLGVIESIVDATRLVPGAHLPIDGQAVKGVLTFLDGVTPGGYLDNGTLRIKHASTAPGGQVCGTFDAEPHVFTFGFLVGGPPAPAPPEAPRVRPSAADVGELMRQCRPGGRP